MTNQNNDKHAHEIGHGYIFNVYFHPGAQYAAQAAEIQKLEKIVAEMKQALVKEAAKDAQSHVAEVQQTIAAGKLERYYGGVVSSAGDESKPHLSLSCTREVATALNALICVEKVEASQHDHL